jgi:hypothetical protein
MPVTARRGLVRALTAFTEAGDESSTTDQAEAFWL